MPITENDKLLIHLPAPAPDGWLDKVKQRFPQLTVRWEITYMDGPDVINADALSDEAWEGVTLLCLYPPPSASKMRNVRFVQLGSAGSDRWLNHERYLDPNVIFCSGSGCHAPQIAEWVIGAWLSHEHHFPTYMEQQRSIDWKPRVADKPVTDSVRRRVGILGYGAIGRQIARLSQALGMEVYAYTFRPRDTPESRQHQGYCVPGTGDQDGAIPARWFSGSSSLDIEEFLKQDLDMLVVSLPLNPGTRGLIGRKEFETLGRRGGKTFVVNIARGPIVDTDALSDALRSGLISGAAVDVTDPEPLPENHPLWTAPNVLITPHISWQSKTVIDRVGSILLDNLERYHKGEPLLNLIQKGHSVSSGNS